MLKLTYNNIICHVEGPSSEIAIVSEELTFSCTQARFSRAYRQGNWNGKKTLFNSTRKTFPTGLIPYISNKLNRKGIQYNLNDIREEVKPDIQPITAIDNFERREYQLEAVTKFIDNLKWGRGIIKLSTRAGKTIIAGALIQRMNLNSLFIVGTKDLLYQSKDELKSVFGLDVGIIGDSKFSPKKLTVAMINSLSMYFGPPRKRKFKKKGSDETDQEFTQRLDEYRKKQTETTKKWYEKRKAMEEYLSTVNLAIRDECHSASKSDIAVFNNMKNCRYRIGLSATPLMGDKENKLTTQAILGEIFHEVPTESLVEQGYIAKPVVYMLKNNAMIGMFDTYDEEYNDGIVFNKERNLLIALSAAKLRRKGLDVLILVEKIEHGNELMKLLSPKFKATYVTGSNSSEERKKILNQLKSGLSDIVIATRIFNQGINIPYLGAVVIGGGYKSAVLTYQRYGRPITKTVSKRVGIIVDFFDMNGQWLPKHAEERANICKKDNAFEFHLLENISELEKKL